MKIIMKYNFRLRLVIVNHPTERKPIHDIVTDILFVFKDTPTRSVILYHSIIHSPTHLYIHYSNMHIMTRIQLVYTLCTMSTSEMGSNHNLAIFS